MSVTCPYCKLDFETTKRSNPQNRYYFGVVVKLISSHTGFSSLEIHEILKHKFLKRGVVLINNRGGREFQDITESTTDLNTVQFEEYLSKIRQWASEELSVYIPLPHEVIE